MNKQPQSNHTDQAAGARRKLPVPIATSTGTSEFLRDRKAEIKQRNLKTTDRIQELVQEIDERIAAGERPFGKYLDAFGAYPAPPAAIYDFEQLWKRRFKLPETVRFRIERFGCQLNWMRQDGEPGYWNATKDILPFAQEFAILSLVDEPWVQSLADCGLFIKDFKGNRVDACWDVCWCRKCNWNGRIQPKQRSYSPRTWVRGGHWFGYTVSYETDPARARAIGRMITEEDYNIANPDSAIYGERFRPPNFNVWGQPGLERATPAFIRAFAPDIDHPLRRYAVQYAFRRFLGACQHGIGSLVHCRLLDGAEQNCEVVLGFLPFRVRWHVHGIACSTLHGDPQAIADRIKEEVDGRLAELAQGCAEEEWPLNQRLYANVMVVEFVDHEQLLKWIEYMFKTVNYWEPLYGVHLRPENSLRDGRLRPTVDRLLREEIQFMREWVDEVFDSKGLSIRNKDGTRRLSRSCVRGCLKFGDGDQFIRWESNWEKRRRRHRAKQQRQRRKAKQEKVARARVLAEREGL